MTDDQEQQEPTPDESHIPTPEELQQRNRAKMEQKAEYAFADFLWLGPNRSVGQLLKMYQEKRRVNGKDENVPTTNRNTIYQWAKEFDWYARAAAYDKEQSEATKQDYAQIRRVRFDELATLSKDAVEALARLINGEKTRDDVRLKAIEAVLNRTGLTEQKAGQKTGVSETRTTKPPTQDADEQTLQQWLAEARKSSA